MLALFPDIPNSLYRAFVTAFTRLYPAIWMLTIAIALLDLAGFVALAKFVIARTWLPLAVFLAAVTLDHFSQRALSHVFSSGSAPQENAIALHRSLGRLVRYSIVLAAMATFSHLIGGFRPLFTLLSEPVMTLGDKGVSVLVLIKA